MAAEVVEQCKTSSCRPPRVDTSHHTDPEERHKLGRKWPNCQERRRTRCAVRLSNCRNRLRPRCRSVVYPSPRRQRRPILQVVNHPASFGRWRQGLCCWRLVFAGQSGHMGWLSRGCRGHDSVPAACMPYHRSSWPDRHDKAGITNVATRV